MPAKSGVIAVCGMFWFFRIAALSGPMQLADNTTITLISAHNSFAFISPAFYYDHHLRTLTCETIETIWTSQTI
jgi:hypothetical protein